MNTASDRLIRAITEPQPEANPLQKALDDYHRMEAELHETREESRRVLVENGTLLAEVNMLRETLERADTDRMRLQAISSTLLGRLLAINDCIAGAVKASIKDGIDAANVNKPDHDDLETAGEEAQDIFSRLSTATDPIGAAFMRRRTPDHLPQVTFGTN